jgi:hypothetical protein
MTVRLVTVVPVQQPSYRYLLAGRTSDGVSVVAIRGMGQITGDSAGWQVYVGGSKLDVNVLNAKIEPTDHSSMPAFIGADDPVNYQLQFVHDGRTWQIGNRVNMVDDEPIDRIDPDDENVTITFSNEDNTVYVVA